MSTCRYCRYWNREEADRVLDGFVKSERRGACMRFPPVPDLTTDLDEGRTRRPITDVSDWCGEFQERERPRPYIEE